MKKQQNFLIYQPAEDSYLLEKYVSKLAKNKSFLDMGAGSGIQSTAAIKANASSVLAADISQEVIKNLKKKKIPCIKSDLFKNIKGKFDIIAFNPPYLPEDKREDKESQLATTGGKRGDEITLKFLRQSVKHLNPGGFILLIVSSHTPHDKMNKLIKEKNLKKKILGRKKLFMEELQLWKLTSPKTL